MLTETACCQESCIRDFSNAMNLSRNISSRPSRDMHISTTFTNALSSWGTEYAEDVVDMNNLYKNMEIYIWQMAIYTCLPSGNQILSIKWQANIISNTVIDTFLGCYIYIKNTCCTLQFDLKILFQVKKKISSKNWATQKGIVYDSTGWYSIVVVKTEQQHKVHTF